MVERLAALCGQILVVGVAGAELSGSERRALANGERGGVVLFKRNVGAGPAAIAALTRSIREAAAEARVDEAAPPLVAIDQEGGRVVRIGPPALSLTAMRRVGDLGDVAFATRLAEVQARELAAMGITMSFAPVADVHTREDNPIIGDRSFATSPEVVAHFAAAWAEGLDRGGVLSCAKHFPGHGDTTVDSHLALPRVERPREALDRIELASFRALARNPKVHSMMTAHVVYPALDPSPATLSHAICTSLLRAELGFEGVLFSDDLEMKAIQLPIAEAAVRAVTAGCDVLLVCSREDLAEEAHAALVREAETSPAFRARCVEARARFTAMKARIPQGATATDAELPTIFERSRDVAAELTARLAGSAAAQGLPTGGTA